MIGWIEWNSSENKCSIEQNRNHNKVEIDLGSNKFLLHSNQSLWSGCDYAAGGGVMLVDQKLKRKHQTSAFIDIHQENRSSSFELRWRAIDGLYNAKTYREEYSTKYDFSVPAFRSATGKT